VNILNRGADKVTIRGIKRGSQLHVMCQNTNGRVRMHFVRQKRDRLNRKGSAILVGIVFH